MKISFIVFISILVTSSISLIAQEIPPDSMYLGQTPPGNIPKTFNLPLTNGHRACERILNAGDHSFDFEVENIPSGIYFYVIKTNTFVIRKK